jgi:mono/diheme cytochrome c family protein
MPMTFSTKRFLITTTLVIAVGCATAMPAAAQDAKKGQEVYAAQKCQVCHAIAGTGNKALPLDGVGAKLPAADIKQWILQPVEAAAKHKSTKKPLMPNKFGSLPAADVDALVAYMLTLK